MIINTDKNKKKGFTLVELIIYMGLLSALLVILSQVFTSIISAKLDSESRASIDQDATYLISKLTYDISRATAISSPSTFTACTSSCSLQISIGGVSNTYSINSGNLRIVNNLGTNVLNGYNTSITAFNLTRIGNGVTPTNTDTIKINFTIQSDVIRSSGNEVKNYEITVAPR